MRFAYPYFIPLLVLPVALILIYTRSYLRTARSLQIFAAGSLSKIIDPDHAKQRYQRWILRFVSVIFLILAVSGPQWGYQWKEVQNRGLELIFALDSSKSMLASDIQPNRFERAKLAIKDFLAKIPGNRVGLIAFAGSSFLQCPLTMDYSAFNITLDGLNIQSIPQGGTAISTAVVNAGKALRSATGSKILILITDGEDHEGNPAKEAAVLAKNGVHIYTIGIGSTQGAPIEITDPNGQKFLLKDSAGKQVITILNEPLLKNIASAGNGSYVKADGLSLGLEELYRQKLLPTFGVELKSQKQKQYIDRYQIPLILAFICMLLEIAIGFHLQNLARNMAAAVLKPSASPAPKERET